MGLASSVGRSVSVAMSLLVASSILPACSVEGASGTADAGARDVARDVAMQHKQAWLLIEAGGDSERATRVVRGKGPPPGVREQRDLEFTVVGPGGAEGASGYALSAGRKHVRFANIDGPEEGHHWEDAASVVWVPIDSEAQGRVRLSLRKTRIADIAIPEAVARHSSHSLEELSVTGPPEARINIVIVADGYTAAEAAKFHSDAAAVSELLLQTPPYDAYRTLFNVYRLTTESPESGADHPDVGIDVLNRFGSSFNCGGVARALCANDAVVLSTVYELLPEADQVLLLVNDERYGGQGGQVATSSTHPSSPHIAVHEFGHTLARLADEYETSSGGEPLVAPEANVSLTSEYEEIKWNHWIDEETLLPTPEALASSNLEPIGAYEGARYHERDLYRPASNCKMRSLDSGFCAVCVEASVRKFHAHSAVVLAATPDAETPLDMANRTDAVEFQIELTDLPNLEARWLLGEEDVGTGLSFTLTPEAAAQAGTLRVEVTHTTELVRSDPTGNLTEAIEWDLTDGVVEDPGAGEPGGCGCQQSSAPSGLWALFLALFFVRRRQAGN